MVSNRQRNALSRRLFGRLVALKTEQMDINSDPLADRYDVNKFGIVVEHDDVNILRQIHKDFIEKLKADGFTISPFLKTEQQASKADEFEAKAFISNVWPMKHLSGKRGVFHISIGG